MVHLSMINNAKIGFIGLGNMGAFMAKHLMNKGHELNVLDMNPQSVQELTKLGAKTAENPGQIAANSEVIITMLPACPQVTEVYTAPNGILSGIKPSTICLDSSTIGIEASKSIAKLCEEKACHFSDAPVSGGVVGAQNGTLTFMVGTKSTERFEAAKPILECMGKNIVYVGDNGHGLAAKLCNNMMLGISMIGIAETMNLGLNLGLDKKILTNILNTSTGRCWAGDTNNPVPGALDNPNIPGNNEYAGGFGVALIAKDLGLAQGEAISTQSVTVSGSHAYNVYKHLTNSGAGLKDFGYYYEHIRNKKE